MQKDKHNIYSKEELLKLIKEGKNAPADMDEFDLEALEGLKILDNHHVLNTLNKDVDKIVIAEKKKEKQRKTIYYFSAAASLFLLVGLIFFFKNSDVIQNEKVVASAEVEKPKEENLQQSLSAPVQAEAQETYEAKEPEQAAKTSNLKRERIALAKNKAKQKSDNTLEQEKYFGAKTEEGAVLRNQNEERKELVVADNNSNMAASGELAKNGFEQANKDVSAVTSTQVGVVAADEDRAANKSKKITASMSQPSAAYQSKDQQSDAEQSPAAPAADAKKAEEKAKSSLSYSNLALKNDVAKNYKEPAFINGDSTFATYVKQNLKISSATSSGIIIVSFIVTKNGTATNIEILKSLNNCDACSKDVIDFIKSIKKWQPAIQNGNAISAPKKISIQYN